MSASFYDLLKYAKTGIAAPDMTAYDKMRAVAMGGGGAIKTLTGVPPLSFRANGKPLISWSMLGNSQQNGTPAPDAPIMPEFVGERTENIYDKTNVITILPIGDRYGVYAPFGTYSIYNDTANAVLKFTNDGEGREIACPPKSTATVNLVSPFPKRKSGFFMPYNDESLGDVSIVAGSTPPSSYIPYGWAIPITNAGQTTPIYLGQTQTVRRIKKLVLTGEENWNFWSGGTGVYYTADIQNYLKSSGITCVCSHYPANDNVQGASAAQYGVCFIYNNPAYRLYIVDTAISTTDALKSYLAVQYAAGTPVTVWYVLAEPETEIVNEPLAKIGTYADELHSTDAGVSIPTAKGQNTLTVDTELQPSSMTITYR